MLGKADNVVEAGALRVNGRLIADVLELSLFRYCPVMLKTPFCISTGQVAADAHYENVEPLRLAADYYDAVKEGVTLGTSVNAFSPDETCTRAQIVTFIYRAAGKPEVTGTNPFTDVEKNDYYDAILWAVENGITKGVATDKFAPNQTCTRAQGVTFLYRGIGLY